MTEDELRSQQDDNYNIEQTTKHLRKRSSMLRVQAFAAIGGVIIAAVAIAWIFMVLHRQTSQSQLRDVPRDPYDYRLMEARHEAISIRLKEMEELLIESKQELISDKYGAGGKDTAVVAKSLQSRSEELKGLRVDLNDRISKDRQNMYLEIVQLRTERDRAKEDGAEKQSFITLIGEAVMRAGVLILAVYLIAIVSGISKYWLRVADHLNAIADSVDLLRAARLSLQPAIAALTPHAIDFQVDDFNPLRTARDLIANATTRSG